MSLRRARTAALGLALSCALAPVRVQAQAQPAQDTAPREPQTISQEVHSAPAATSTAEGAISRPAQERPGIEEVRRNQTLQRPPLASPPPPPAAPAAPAAPVETRPRVLEVKFEGSEPSGLRALVPILDGAPLDTRDVRDSVRALHASARFSQVSAWAEPVPEAATPGEVVPVRVIFVLTPVQRLLLLTFSGHQALADSILHQTANLQANAEYRPELVGRAIEAIKQAYNRVGHRQVTVTPKTKEVAGGVQLELAIAEGRATRIASVAFTGDPGLSHDELLAAFKLGEGDVLNLGLVDEGVKGLRDRYREAGRLRARVEAPVVSELADRPGEARLTVPVQAGPRVRFHVRGNGSFTDELLATKLRLDGDEPLDAQAAQDLAQRLRRFYVQAGFYEVRILWREIASKPGEVELVFSVDEGPQVRVEQLQFQGNLGVPTAQLRERVLLQLTDSLSPDPAFGADPGELSRRGAMGRLTGQPPDRTKVEPETVYDPVLYARAIKQIEDLYKSLGYLLAKVGPARLEPLEGVDRASKDSLRDASNDLPRDEVKQAAALRGAKTAQFPLSKRRMKVIIPIDEGDRSIVSQLVIEGGNEVPAAELDAVVKLTVGGPFSYYLVEEGRSALAGLFTRRGYFYAKVEDEERFLPAQEGDEPGTARVEVRYRIQAGSIVRVGYVEVVGQRHTQEQLIRDLVKLQPGDVLSPEGLDRGQQALLLTGLFFSATLTPRNPDVAEPEKTVLVQVRERPRRELQTSFGYSIEDGPRASATFTYGNLFGRNLTFTALARANFPYSRFPTSTSCTSLTGSDGQVLPLAQQTCDTSIEYPGDPLERLVDLGFAVPRLLPLTELLRLNLDFIHERAIRPTYQLTKYFATQVALTLNQAQPLAASLTYEVGYQVLALGQRTIEQELAGVDSQFFRQAQGQLFYSSLRPLVTLDLRDDLARPRKGFYMQVQADWLKSLYTPTSDWLDVKLIKLQGLVAGYLPLPGLASLVVSARGGRVYRLDGDGGSSQVPGDRRFYLGGATTLRGFHQDAVQPQDVREAKRDLITSCANLAAPLQYCSDTVRVLSAGASSDGGELMIGFGAELRIPLSNSVELALFWDAGNLWADPRRFDALSFTVLRQAVGLGLRYLTPIGRIAVDLGFNLSPDIDLGDPRAYPYFAIDSL